MDQDNYPDDSDLEFLANLNMDNPKETFEAVLKMFESTGYGSGKVYEDTDDYGHCINLELSTGGWSGNEDMIQILQRNDAFWLLSWYSTTRGGHYKFRRNI